MLQVAELGLDITSVHALALQAVPPVAHPQKFPAPSVVALQAAADVKANVVQAAATVHEVPLKAHVER